MPTKHDDIVKALADKLANTNSGSVFKSRRLRRLISSELDDHPRGAHTSQAHSTGHINRRQFLKMLGLMTAAGASTLVAYDRILDGERITGMASSTCSPDITVGANTQKLISVGSGETMENKLIDISNTGADLRISASGSNWMVRNVGIQGQCDIDKGSGYWNRLHMSGHGVVDRVYLGDGCSSRSGATFNCGGAGCPSSHSGNVEVKRCHIAGWSDNGFYTAHCANNGHGTFNVHDCYFHDNNVAHLRIASDGSTASRCVIHNTGNVPPLYAGVVNSKGVYTSYGTHDQVVEVHDCNIDMSNTNGNASAFNSNNTTDPDMSTIQVYDTQYIGDIIGPYVTLVSGNGHKPDTTPPDGVPMSATDAACGTGSSSTSPSSTTTSGGSGTSTSSSSPC